MDNDDLIRLENAILETERHHRELKRHEQTARGLLPGVPVDGEMLERDEEEHQDSM
jgi:hypothetical protein